MMNLTWKQIGELHRKESSANRTMFRVLAYGMFVKNRLGYTPDQLIFILRKNFPNMSDVQWGEAVEFLMNQGYIYVTNRKETKNTLSLTKKGKETYFKVYMNK